MLSVNYKLAAENEHLRALLRRILDAHDQARSLESGILLDALIEAEEALKR